MQVIVISPIGFAANTYLLTEDGVHAVAIDPAQPRIRKEAERRGLCVQFVLLTHGHFDHIGGCAALQAAGAKVGCLDVEKALALGNDNMGAEFGVSVPPFSVDFTFQDGEVLDLCGIKLQVISTAGHTAGSCCFRVISPLPREGVPQSGGGGALFTGDTLFAGDVGRTDLPTGSATQLRASLKKLAALAGDCTVYPGHGMQTTLEKERSYGYLQL